MRPDLVTSPKSRLRGLNIEHVNEEEGWSIATFEWLHEDGQWRKRIGMRWNGADGALGNPIARNNFATWFSLPESVDLKGIMALFVGEVDA